MKAKLGRILINKIKGVPVVTDEEIIELVKKKYKISKEEVGQLMKE